MEQIENTIVKGLLYNEDYTRKVYPYLKPEFFEGTTKQIFKLYAVYFNKFNKQPSVETLVVALQKSKLDEQTFTNILEQLQDVTDTKNEPYETDWLIEETLDYCKRRALFDGIYKALDIIDGEKVDEYGKISELLEDALSVSFDTSLGSDYFDDLEARYDWYTNEETRIKFSLDALNDLSNGGLPPKTLNVLLASTNAGKSALMCYCAAEWLRAGKNVLYITCEMSEESVLERVDMNLLDMDSKQLRKTDKNTFREKINKLKKTTLGKLKVKEYPTGSANAIHFDALLKEYKQKNNFEPDVIIIDYINICSSSRYSTTGTNSYTYIKAIAEELRGLAVKYSVPVLSATQVNRSGTADSEPDMTSVSDSFGLAMTVDWMVALYANDQLASLKKVCATLLKTRYGNKSSAKPKFLEVDYDRMRYKDSNDYAPDDEKVKQQLNEARSNKSEQNDLMDKIRNKGEVQWD